MTIKKRSTSKVIAVLYLLFFILSVKQTLAFHFRQFHGEKYDWIAVELCKTTVTRRFHVDQTEIFTDNPLPSHFE